ncbi:MAG TPA: beta-N-acetylhexosaminidase [Gammaproteobacteria bacterium]|nr:beta-N-acetylhexosaminidase [Gammaproteobacteria bacterium]
MAGAQPGPVMLDLAGTELDAEEREILVHPLVGGVVLFRRNYAGPAQLARLTATVHALRPTLVVAVDQEGGRVQRFREGFTPLPPAAVLGRIHDRDPGAARDAAWRTGRLMARELRRCGVDISLAPVLDLAGNREVIGDRALHPDPEVTAALAGAWITGMGAAGMAAVGKHFPGHGGVRGDSHRLLPVDDRSLEQIRKRDLLPFARLAAGVGGLMTAHVHYPRVDSLPASLSRRWLRDELRGRLGFAGAVLSDDLSMAGAAGFGDMVERTRLALRAGSDMVLVCNDREGALAVLDGPVRASGESSGRIAALRGGRGAEPREGWAATEAADRQLVGGLCATDE